MTCFLKFIAIGMVIGLGLTSMAPAQAAFPERTVTFYIMHKPGGGTDTTFRAFLPFFEKYLGGKVAAVNKTGAGGAKMLNFLARAKPDGYTIAWNSTSVLTTTNIGNVPFDYKALDHLGRVHFQPLVMAVLQALI